MRNCFACRRAARCCRQLRWPTVTFFWQTSLARSPSAAPNDTSSSDENLDLTTTVFDARTGPRFPTASIRPIMVSTNPVSLRSAAIGDADFPPGASASAGECRCDRQYSAVHGRWQHGHVCFIGTVVAPLISSRFPRRSQASRWTLDPNPIGNTGPNGAPHESRRVRLDNGGRRRTGRRRLFDFTDGERRRVWPTRNPSTCCFSPMRSLTMRRRRGAQRRTRDGPNPSSRGKRLCVLLERRLPTSRRTWPSPSHSGVPGVCCRLQQLAQLKFDRRQECQESGTPMKFLRAMFVGSLCVVLSNAAGLGIARAQHFDVLAQQMNGQVSHRHGRFRSPTNGLLGLRVFHRDFDGDFAINNPGFNSLGAGSPRHAGRRRALPRQYGLCRGIFAHDDQQPFAELVLLERPGYRWRARIDAQ